MKLDFLKVTKIKGEDTVAETLSRDYAVSDFTKTVMKMQGGKMEADKDTKEKEPHMIINKDPEGKVKAKADMKEKHSSMKKGEESGTEVVENGEKEEKMSSMCEMKEKMKSVLMKEIKEELVEICKDIKYNLIEEVKREHVGKDKGVIDLSPL